MEKKIRKHSKEYICVLCVCVCVCMCVCVCVCVCGVCGLDLVGWGKSPLSGCL